ncbi:RNA methyltransferase [Acidianus sulfidivorans JP7]|uniref:RNA methyltransferase n=1 Tax=Acidianus sulfidivorans JP7 TaxID=619593 RepID=A0A2U9IM08_9CREN|nr:THUMP domain-containing protein [Acidianus sulfidivorans]AWR97043.1 RNA methyltransferase [Acidianus sulfidivorans JP7]
MQPKLIITTKPGKSRKCGIEILNRILLKDENAKVEEIIPNVYFLFTSLPSLQAYGLIISAPPSCIAKIFIVDQILDNTNELYDIAKQLLISKKTKKFYVECINRNTKNADCRSIEIGIGLSVKNIIGIDYKNPDYILFVNIINGKYYLSLMRKGEEKLSVKSL